MKEISEVCIERGINDSNPVIFSDIEVITPKGVIKSPKKIEYLSLEENMLQGGDVVFRKYYDVEEEDIVFSIKILDKTRTDRKDEIRLIQKPSSYTENQIDALGEYFFSLGWPAPYWDVFGIPKTEDDEEEERILQEIEAI